jgi:geranylgeranyl diphosphate synthase type II
MTTSLTQRMAEVRAAVDESLRSYTEFDRDCPSKLRSAIQYSLLAPGKRLRPLLTVFAAEACGADMNQALPIACAVEMVHCYSLIHDDLPAMDDDDLRRGRPTCHRQFDEATAILAGDALLALAFQVLAADVTPPQVAAQCCAVLADAAGPRNLVGGQADDLDVPADAGLEELQTIHRRKTGAMFLASLKLGGLVARADSPRLEMLESFGADIGLAFQIVDDLLDVSGSEEELGKRVRKDSAKGKLTFPGLLGRDESRRRADALIERAVATLEPWGAPAETLIALARFVVERNH